MKKHNRAKWKASIASVVSIFLSGLAFYLNEEKKKKRLFISKLADELFEFYFGREYKKEWNLAQLPQNVSL